jgi:hypothetical protein
MVNLDSKELVFFDNCRPNSLLQVLFRGIHWLRFWAQLQRCEAQQALMVETCRTLKIVAISLFVFYEWPSLFRIGF